MHDLVESGGQLPGFCGTQAFAAAALAGVGNGGLNPSQSALLAALARRDQRHRATAISRVAGNAGVGIGAALGGVVAAIGLTGFVTLSLANVITSASWPRSCGMGSGPSR